MQAQAHTYTDLDTVTKTHYKNGFPRSMRSIISQRNQYKLLQQHYSPGTPPVADSSRAWWGGPPPPRPTGSRQIALPRRESVVSSFGAPFASSALPQRASLINKPLHLCALLHAPRRRGALTTPCTEAHRRRFFTCSAEAHKRRLVRLCASEHRRLGPLHRDQLCCTAAP